MDFDLTQDQQEISRTAADFLAARYTSEEIRRLAQDDRGFTDAQWNELSGLGWPGLLIGEDHGGMGLGMVELAILQEALGHALAPTPFFSSAAAALVIDAMGEDSQRDEWLTKLATGESRGVLALYEQGGEHGFESSSIEPRGSSLSGTKIAVPDASSADVLVVVASGGRHYLVDPRADSVTIEPAQGLDPTRKLFSVHLDEAQAHQLPGEGGGAARAHLAIAVALAAESVGIAQRTMEMAVQYAKERKQFGTPIGAYQAVSHRCAQMLLETEGARSTTLFAAWALDHDPQAAPLAAAMAKAYASDAGWRVAASAMQVLGGIGFTWEHDLHFFLKRARANAHSHGDSRFHRAAVAQLAGI